MFSLNQLFFTSLMQNKFQESSIQSLSYDVAVFQSITSCNKKCYDHKCINTFAGICNVIDDVRNNSVNFH